jgi:hypothetical protein
MTFPSVIVTSVKPTEGRTLVADMMAFLGARQRAPLTAFTAHRRIEGSGPSLLSYLLGPEVYDLHAFWGPSEPESGMFMPVGPSSLERPFILDLDPDCAPAFYRAIDIGLLDGVPGDIFMVHVMTMKSGSLDLTKELAVNTRRLERLKRIGARQIFLANDLEGAIKEPTGRSDFARMTHFDSPFFEFFRSRSCDMSLDDMMSAGVTRLELSMMEYQSPWNRNQLVEFDAGLRSWIARTWASLIGAGLTVDPVRDDLTAPERAR